MSDPIETTVNTPPDATPATPHADERNINYSSEPVTQVAFEMRMEVIYSGMNSINSRLDNTNLLMIGVLVALSICFLTLFFEYQQFKIASSNDYTQKSKELNDDRYELLQQKYDFIDNKIATPSSN